MSFDVATKIVRCDHCDTAYLVAPGRFTGFPVDSSIECGVCGTTLFQSTDLDPWYPLCQVDKRVPE